MNKLTEAFLTIRKLRDPVTGCPWDLEQTHQSLAKYLVEECYEFLAALASSDDLAMSQELGDILLQIYLHSILAEERGAFSIENVAQQLQEKIIRRHPHVFGNVKVENANDVETNWQQIKAQEKNNPQNSSAFPDDLLKLPGLLAALKIGKISEKINFDWENSSQVAEKVEEEWKELQVELQAQHKEKSEEELGDFLFTVVQLARHLEIDPELALIKANAKFIKRFHRVEQYLEREQKDIHRLSTKELDQYWNRAKGETKKC
ncbi:MAG: nucleoside triphosphate pyrophosphohydrolase [Bdellovibrionales bacterium GWA2_49_15]|nr:MAG: nucleoside triphosphate pyrophosphohydrolase [Bdellovibrionales bacterium GWA2_49_15]